MSPYQFISFLHHKLESLEEMWGDRKIQFYNDKKLLAKEKLAQDGGAVFLAGPTSRDQILECNWRSEAVSLLRASGFGGWIYVPEPRGEAIPGDFTDHQEMYEWESSRLLSATHVVFWIPRDAKELLGLNTNLELGMFIGKVMSRSLPLGQALFVGWPKSAQRMGLPRHYLEKTGMTIYSDLCTLCHAVAKQKIA